MMPSYDFLCNKCGHTEERFLQGKDVEWFKRIVCPKCPGIIHRQIGAGGGVIFKGDGFYCTTYRNNNKDK